MRRFLSGAMALFLASGSSMVVPEVKADLVLSLTCSADPMALHVGQSVSFQVHLDGLDVKNGDELDYLCALVDYPDNFALPTPTTVATGGPILPLANPEDFLSTSDASSIDGTFYTTSFASDHHICDNGVFFSFDAVVEKLGSGQLTFDTLGVDATRFNPEPPNIPISDTPTAVGLSFQVVSVPEPSVWALLVAAGLVAMAYRRKRRK